MADHRIAAFIVANYIFESDFHYLVAFLLLLKKLRKNSHKIYKKNVRKRNKNKYCNEQNEH